MQIPLPDEKRDEPPRVAHTKPRSHEAWRRLAVRLRGFMCDAGRDGPRGFFPFPASIGTSAGRRAGTSSAAPVPARAAIGRLSDSWIMV